MKKSKLLNKIIISFFAILTLFITGCPSQQDNLYPIAEEQYNLGWILHNVDDSTPSYVTYSENELAVYNYSYSFPGQSPQKFDNIVFWADPMQDMSGASHVRFGAPHNRVNYIRWNPATDPEIYEGNFEWNYQTFNYINYVVRDSSLEQFAYEISTGEAYHGEWYDNRWIVKPLPGNYGDVTIGVPPYLPTFLTANESFLRLGSPLLSSQNRNSYIRRETELSACGDDCVYISLPKPTIKLYKDSSLLFEQSLTTSPSNQGLWDYTSLKYNLLESGAGNYNATIEIPLDYPVYKNTKISYAFYYDGLNNLDLPALNHIDFKSRFDIGEPIFVNASTVDNSDTIKLHYMTDNNPNWALIQNNHITINNVEVNEISLKIDIISADANVSYEIYPISLKARNILCLLNDVGYNINDDFTVINATCGDDYGNFVRGIKVSLFEDGNFIGNAVTGYNGLIELEVDGQHTGQINFSFEGTGSYNPNFRIPVPEDKDCDGVNDRWEDFYGFPTNNINLPSDDADQDSDGRSDLEEGITGTDPSANDVFGIIGRSISNGNFVLTIPSFPGNKYSVDGKQNMMSFTWTNIMNFTGAEDAETTTVDIPLSLGFSFFRANGLSFDDPNCAILETECSDSDGGVNYSQKGIVTYPDNSTNEDMCAWSEDFNKTVLIEYFCEDTGKTEYDCPGACYEGACINSTQNQTNQTLINCTDSDGGLNYYLKGNVSGNIGSGYPDGWQLYEDYCYGNTSLIERYCTSDYTNFTKEYSCPLGCSNGSCNIGCGDGSCNNGETCSSCSIDCWACGTSGGSSGGGGSGSSSRTQTLSIGDITTSVPLTAGKGDSISFYYKSKPHKIEITKINTNDVELRISSKTIDVIITVGETHLVDIDDDNIKDIKISLEKISSKKAYLTIDIIRQTTSVPVCNNNNLCEIGETRTNCPDDCAQESVIVTPLGEQPSYVQKIVCDYNNVCDNDETPITCPSDCKRSYNENLVVGLIVLLALMLIIGFFLFERKTNSLYNLSGKVKKEVLPLLKSNKTLSEIRSYLMFKGFNEKDISSALKYSHNFNLLRNYITKCVGWGYSKDEIERVIKNARWPEHISEDVLETINYKKND